MTLTANELKVLEDALRARAKVLRGEVSGKLGEAAVDAVGMNAGDYADQAFSSGESSLDFAEAQRDIDELAGIDAALAVIAGGSYGLCVTCGEPIPSARLRAQPLALRCVGCQQRTEHDRGEHHSSL